MEAAVLYESIFGNTAVVAEAVATGLRSRPGTFVRVLAADHVRPEELESAQLLVVGGPTHAHGLSSARTRRVGLASWARGPRDGRLRHELEPEAGGTGIRELLRSLPPGHGTRAAAFDTREPGRLSGGAAPAIARALRRRGYAVVGEPAGFLVEGIEGPLAAGEYERARVWAARLVSSPVGV